MHAPSAEAEGGHQLKRHLGSFGLTSIGIGAIIGAGIFVITGQAAALYAGPGIAISFVIAAIICIFTGLCFAELAAMIPVAGGSYTYSYIALGEFPAWIVGWSLVGQYFFSSSTVAVGFSAYFVSFLADFGIVLPAALTNSPIASNASGWYWTGAIVNIPAIILCALLATLIAVGIKAASRMNNIMVIIKLTTLALFIVLGISFINTENWTPFVPQNTGVFGEFGWSGILRASGLLFFAYLGFDSVSTLAPETINPQKDLPRGILGSLIICTVAYIVTALVLNGVVSYKLLNVPDPMSVALDAMGSSFVWLKLLVKLAILAGLASVVLVQFLAITRIFFAISKDGLISPKFGKINKTTSTPIFASVITGVACMCLAGLFPVNILGELVSNIVLFCFSIVCLGVLILRYRHPEMHRPFKVPLVPVVPVLGMLGCWAQMGFLPLTTWLQMIGWMAIGLCVYFAYGRWHSKLRKA